MSFDIFNVSTPLDRISEALSRFGLFTTLMILFALVVVNILERKRSDTEEKIPLLKTVAINIVCICLSFSFTIIILTSVFTKITVSNKDEVRESIQQEYGFTLTDESIEYLYKSRNNLSNEVFYVTDVDGNVQQYIVEDNEFRFLTK